MEDSRVRALLRARELQKRGNASFNILTGGDQHHIGVPSHDKYNPGLVGVGQQIMQGGGASSHSNRSVGICPGLWIFSNLWIVNFA